MGAPGNSGGARSTRSEPAGFTRWRTLAPGERIGKFVVKKVLRARSYCGVYQAVDRDLRRLVTIKVGPNTLADPCGLAGRLEDEAKIQQTLARAGAPRVYHFGYHSGRPVLVLEFVEGFTLREIARAGVSPSLAAKLVARAARAAGRVHEFGFLHMDLKPDNLVVDRRGKVHIIDYGSARPAPGLRPRGLRRSVDRDALNGTPAFMAPEQARGGDSWTSVLSEVFCLGGTLFELLTGRLPFEAPNFLDAVKKAKDCDFPRDLLRAPGIPASLRDICLKAMCPNRHRRFRSADEFAGALEVFVRRPRRRQWGLTAAIILLVTLASIGYVLGW